MEPSALSLSLSLNLSFYERALLDSLAEITTTTTTTTTSVNQLEWVWLPHPLESLCLLLLLLRALVVDSYRPPEPSCILLCQLMRFLDETWHHLPFRPDNCHPWTGSRDHVRKDGFPTSVVLGRVIFGFGRVNFFFFFEEFKDDPWLLFFFYWLLGLLVLFRKNYTHIEEIFQNGYH